LFPTFDKGVLFPPFEKGVLCPTFVMKNLIYFITYKIVQIPVYKEKVGEFEKEKDCCEDLQSGLA